MIVEKDRHYINGSSALVPERKINKEKKEEYNKLQKSKKERELRQLKEKNRKKKSVMKVIALIFILGLTLTGRYGIIFNMQKELSTIKNDITRVNSENEALKIDLLRVSSYDSVKTIAEKQLKMVETNNSNAFVVDFSKNNFKTNNNEQKQTTIIERLKNILF
ncbi:hypothetical protein [Clostridium amazonitimonense]|uniref:hypothetical protein n=1 Tax=Clostridium amazonitimonense TaxID=1499689 RepID=UPI000509B415|nr:hypothetical protein [Clostridium amazonitimonense]